MRAVYKASTYVEGRAKPLIYLESVKPGGGGYDVDDGIDGAHLVEVNLFHRLVVNFSLACPK